MGFFLRWAVTLGWAAQIFSFSTGDFGAPFTALLLAQILGLLHVAVSSQTFQFLHHLMRKSAHMTEYALLSMLLYYSMNRSSDWSKRTGLWALLIAAVYSLSDEFHQMFVPGRGPSLFDSGIDTGGAFLGILIVYASSHLLRKKRKPVETRAEELIRN
jgi:VanZ family protein